MRRLAIIISIAVPCGTGADVPSLYDQALGQLQLAQSFDCSERKTCKQMSSCAEACYRLTVCGEKSRDRDKDGIPCENVCSKPCQ